MDKTYEKWCEKLLDTGKGNRLINFKDSKSRSLDIVAPGIEKVFEKIASGQRLKFFDIDSSVRKMKFDLNDDGAKTNFERITKKQVIENFSENLKQNQILPFKKWVPVSGVITNLKKLASASINEKGINVLYIAFGELVWKENEKDDGTIRSPLVLIPVSISKEKDSSIYELSQYEEEVKTNPTLVYKLKHEKSLELPGINEANFEEEGLVSYLSRVEEFACKQGWSVEKTATISTFSFLKLDMYMDLKENEEKILCNNQIRRLLNKQSDPVEEEIDFDKFFSDGKEVYLHNVVDADSSQMQAIVRAKRGKSIVLQGPPGTGKSQTITNIIAESLYDGKKILFVSEKLAALNVVQNNLKKAGLADCCLELHSNKSNKKEVVGELYRALNLRPKAVAVDAATETQELKNEKKKLDDYACEMHKIVPSANKSAYEMLSIVSNLHDVPSFEFVFSGIDDKDVAYVSNATDVINDFKNYTKLIGYDYRKNPWFGFVGAGTSFEEKIELKKNISAAYSFLKSVMDKAKKFSSIINENFDSINALNNNYELLKSISQLSVFNNALFLKKNLEKIVQNINNYNKNTERLNTITKSISEKYNDKLFECDLDELRKNFVEKYGSIFRIFNSNYKNDLKTLQNCQKNPKEKIKYSKIVELLNFANEKCELVEQIGAEKQELDKMLEIADLNYKGVEKELENLLVAATQDIILEKELSKEEFKKAQSAILDFLFYYEENKSALESVLKLQALFDISVLNFQNGKISDLSKKLKLILDNFDSFDNWIRFSSLLTKIKELDLLDFILQSIDNKIERETLDKTFKLLFYTQLAHSVLMKNPVLKSFNVLSHEAAVQNFRRRDKLRFEIAKAEIVARLSSQMPNPNSIASGSQVATLAREANKKSKLKPVRVLFKEIGNLIQTLKPCFLMSPLSVSTYLDFDTTKFDIVVFDEASQIFPWDSVGAIARGAQVIVVGDSKQMPPSNFFNAGVFDEEAYDETEEDDSLDFESILDLSASTFDQSRLNWHYRSKTEDLIAFSNANFYDNSLVTFPAAFKKKPDMGVDFYYVEDGVFNRKTNQNLIEAEKVADLVFEHAKKHPERSLGVVAFSIAQQYAIEDVVAKRREKHRELDEFFDGNSKEPFFVKNLETVQGDERDTIIFSVAYAKDESGRFIHNFGPLNKKGGERRLNVAITRAKCNVKLVSSIMPYDIDLKKTTAVGSALLRAYLEYAQTGVLQNEFKQNDLLAMDKDAQFEEGVCKVLTDAGYVVDKKIGRSEYKIDLAIKNPNTQDYVLAIECDGPSYVSCKTTRDRDRLRQEVLERMGWKYYRIWSEDWFLNFETEKQKLLTAAKEAVEEFGKVDSQKKTEKTEKNDEKSYIVEKIGERKDLKSLFKEYEPYNIWSNSRPTFDNSITRIVAKESPITKELLLKRIAPLFGREKVTIAVRREFEYQMQYHDEIYKIKDYYTLDPNKKVELRVPKKGDESRDISLICDTEIASGMLEIIKYAAGITKDGLFKTLANLLGYSRIGESNAQRFSKILMQLKNKNMLAELPNNLLVIK